MKIIGLSTLLMTFTILSRANNLNKYLQVRLIIITNEYYNLYIRLKKILIYETQKHILTLVN